MNKYMVAIEPIVVGDLAQGWPIFIFEASSSSFSKYLIKTSIFA